MTVDVVDDRKGTYDARYGRDEPNQIHSVTRWHGSIYIRQRRVNPNGNNTSTRFHNNNRSGNNNCLMANATYQNKSSGHKQYCNASDNGASTVRTADPTITTIDSAVTTTSFSSATAIATGGNKHLVPRNHMVCNTTSNVQLPFLSHGGHVAHSIICSTTSNVQSILPKIVGIHSSKSIVAGVQPSLIIGTTIQ